MDNKFYLHKALYIIFERLFQANKGYIVSISLNIGFSPEIFFHFRNGHTMLLFSQEDMPFADKPSIISPLREAYPRLVDIFEFEKILKKHVVGKWNTDSAGFRKFLKTSADPGFKAANGLYEVVVRSFFVDDSLQKEIAQGVKLINQYLEVING